MARVKTSIAPGASISNSATVTSSKADPNQGDNTASATVYVLTNQPPVAANNRKTLSEDGSLVISVLAN